MQCVFPGRSKNVIDEIDRTLGSHFSFTTEEVDFIINYDIKYRLGLRAVDPAVGTSDVQNSELVETGVGGIASAGVLGPRIPG